MKLYITTLVLASTLSLLGVEAHPSPASPTAPAPLLTRELQERALVARERALLRPAWRPATPVIAVAPGANAPLRRSRGRAADGKNAFRHRAGQRALHPHGDARAEADDSLITAAPVHISYNADLAMPFPLARHLSSRNGHVKRDAAAAETDADEEDDWDCEEEEQEEQAGDESSAAVEPSFTPSDASSTWSEPSSSSSSFSSSSSSAWTETTPAASETDSQEQQQSAQPTTTEEAQPTSTPADTASDTRSNPKIAAEQSSSAQASSETLASVSVSASDAAPAPSSSGTSPIRNATGDLPAGAAPVSEEPVNLVPGSLTADQGCTRFHTVMKGEVCLGLLDWSKDINLTLEQLYSYNPTIDSDCRNLAVGQTVCIGKA